MKNLHQTIFDNSPVALILVDESGTIQVLNKNAEHLFAYGPGELIGKKIEVLVPKEIQGKHPNLVKGYFKNPLTRQMGKGRVLYGVKKGGQKFPIEVGLNPIETNEGVRVLSSIIDISDRLVAEEPFKLAIEAAPSGMLMINSSGVIILVNQQTEKMFQYTRQELIGRRVEILVPDRFRRGHPEHRDTFMKNPEPRLMGAGRELFGLRKDGVEVPIEIGLTPIYTGKEMFVMSSIVDITDSKRAREELEKSEERFRLLVSNVKDYALIALDSVGNVTTWNEGAHRMKGYEDHEILGHHFSAFYTDEDVRVGKPARVLEEALKNGHFMEEGWRVRKDGSRFFANVLITPLVDRNGKVVGFGKLTQDLSEKRRTEARFRNAVEASPNGMVMIDSERKIQLVNQQTLEMFGYREDELIGQSIEILVPDETKEKHPELVRNFMSSPEPRPMGEGRELFGQKKNGTKLRVEIGLRPILNEQELFVIASVVDISKRYKAEQDIKQKKEELEQFAYRTSHDLKAPLLSIGGLLDCVSEDISEGTPKEALENIAKCNTLIKKLQGLIEDILILTKADYGNEGFSEVDFEEIIQTAKKKFAFEIESNRINIIIEALHTSKIITSKTRLTQILENLISNAIKYSDPQKSDPFVLVQTHNDDHLFYVDIKDNGLGFPPNRQDEVFGMFKRFHGGPISGSGLGLYIVKKHISKLSGDISFSSNEGEGTTFSVSIPLHSRAELSS